MVFGTTSPSKLLQSTGIYNCCTKNYFVERQYFLKKQFLKGSSFQMRSQMSAPASTTPIYDYPEHATLTRTTWFDQWTIAMTPEFNSRVNTAMKRRAMRRNIIELIHEAIEVR